MSNSLTTLQLELQQKIENNSKRLNDLLTIPENKRIKKRLLQNLGKLKKQLIEVNNKLDNDQQVHQNDPNNMSQKTSNDSGVDVADNVENSNEKGSQQVWNKKKAKLKLKIVNSEIAELALKKQLKLARKRFNWLSNKGLTPGNVCEIDSVKSLCYLMCYVMYVLFRCPQLH